MANEKALQGRCALQSLSLIAPPFFRAAPQLTERLEETKTKQEQRSALRVKFRYLLQQQMRWIYAYTVRQSLVNWPLSRDCLGSWEALGWPWRGLIFVTEEASANVSVGSCHAAGIYYFYRGSCICVFNRLSSLMRHLSLLECTQSVERQSLKHTVLQMGLKSV